MPLYDYIYVDLPKVASLYSQMTGGVVEVLERSTSQSSSAENKRHYDFRIFKHDAGGSTDNANGVRETIKPHHALLQEVEAGLVKGDHLIDLTDPSHNRSFREPDFRAGLRKTFCIKVCGRAAIEDYARMNAIAGAFPSIVRFVNRSIETKNINSDEYIALMQKLDSLEDTFKGGKSRNNKSSERKNLEDLQAQIKKLGTIETVEDWILEGLKLWVNSFLSGIVNLRIYPSIDRPDEHVFGHLRHECFEDPDTNSIHFTYGSLPTENLTMIGIITSVPQADGESFDPLTELMKDNLSDHESIEQAFRGLFRGFDAFEQMIRTCRYPRVLVYPLLVYRSV